MENRIHPDDLFRSFLCNAYSTDLPVFPVTSHWHYFAEIIRVRSGALKVLRDGVSCLLNAGDAVFINPLMEHSLDYTDERTPAEYSVIRLDMEQFVDLLSYTPDLRGMMLEAERRGLRMVFTARELQKSHMDFMLDQCVEEARSRAFGYDLRIRSYLCLVVTFIIRHWISCGLVPQNYGPGIDPIYTLPAYIARNIREPLKVEELAQYCGLSYPWFARKFHQIYGISCKEYIEKVRIRRVEHYLQFTDCDLNYISRNTGYADCSHLVRDFRKLRGVTPVQFRRSCRQKPGTSDQFP